MGGLQPSYAYASAYLIAKVSKHIPMLKNPCKHWYCLLDAKMLWQPGQSFILTGFVFSLPCQILADLSTWSKERDQLRSSTPCATVLIIWQLFPTHMQPASWNKAKFSVEGLRPDTFWFLRCPACPCTGLFFLLEYYPSPNKIDSTQFINYINRNTCSPLQLPKLWYAKSFKVVHE